MAENNQTTEFDNWCRNKAGESVTSNYCWTIEKFLERKQNEKIESHTFKINGPDDENTSWYMYAIPKPSENPNAVSLFLTNLGKNEVKVSYEISILDKTKTKKRTVRSSEQRIFGPVGSPTGAWGFKSFVSYSALREEPSLLQDGDLVISCQINIQGAEKTVSGSKYPQKDRKLQTNQNSLESLSDDFVKGFSESNCSDLQVNCGGRNFECHEFVLSARSPVFRAMFQSNMTEKRTKTITIADHSPDVIQKMLQYIYSGKVDLDDQQELTRELLKAAEKYGLEMLKKLCEDKLCDSLVLKNSVKNLILGEMFGATKLMKNAMKLLASNMSSVIDTEEWETCTRHHPTLVTEVMRVIVDKKGTKRKINEVE